MAQTFGITVAGAGNGVMHEVAGEPTREVFRQPVRTACCGRTVKVGNVFRDLDDYRSSYNLNGRACGSQA